MKLLLHTLLIPLFYLNTAYGYTELDLDFGYDKQVYGSDRENFQYSRVYSASLAWYWTEYMAIELSFGHGKQFTYESQSYEITGTTLSILGHENSGIDQNFSIGVRQAFSKRGAFIRPILSFGYAKQEITDTTKYTIIDSSTSVSATISEAPQLLENDSVFGSFALSIRITKRFAIKTSVQTVFPAFEFDKAKDDIKYSAGISWIL